MIREEKERAEAERRAQEEWAQTMSVKVMCCFPIHDGDGVDI